MTPEEIRLIFSRRGRAWANLDAVSLAADYAEDCVVESPTMGIVAGRDEIEKLYRIYFQAFPDLKIGKEELVVAGDQVVLACRASGTDTGGFLGFPATGKPFSIDCVFLYMLRDGQIVHERRIYDFSQIVLQLVGESASSTDGGRLYQQTLERARVEQDLKITTEIQRALLPAKHYKRPWFEVVGTSLPCRAIGGDFFDYFDLSSGAIGVALADVAGKGLPAALLAALLQGTLATCACLGGTPAAVLKQVNESLVRRAIEARFATLIYAVLSHNGSLRYCNAGHNPPLVFGSRGLRRLEKGGPVVGAFSQSTFEEEALQLDPGDTLVVFSDGITEALNASGKEFGEEGVLTCVSSNWELSPTELLHRLFEAVRRFSSVAVQGDDMSVLVLRYQGA